ncbi:hypothetical protein Tsubulata_020748 [Turnera subulata]|uniref:Protein DETOXIFICATION n=1 Tax=Turnera subulata TaxID=218843 RepID=A0A9Q0FE56_9ROSI|nr:hypothetical protein Tsubulata_020748 [Turnera subulata]
MNLLSSGYVGRSSEQRGTSSVNNQFSLPSTSRIPRGSVCGDAVHNTQMSAGYRDSLSPLVVQRRKPRPGVVYNQSSSGYSVGSAEPPKRLVSDGEEQPINGSRDKQMESSGVPVSQPQSSDAIDPLTQLMETAYIGRLDGTNGNTVGLVQRKQLSSVSTALLLAVGIGIFEAVALFLGSGPFLNLMGITVDSPMRVTSKLFLSLRALGAPAVVLSLALQGIFRGFKDTKTPVFCLGNWNFGYFPPAFVITGPSAICASILLMLFCYPLPLPEESVPLYFISLSSIHRHLFNDLATKQEGGFLIGRTLAVLTIMTIATSMAARQGPVAMAAHQICMQVWLAVSLLTDALAASGQALIASYFSKEDYKTVREVTNFVLKMVVALISSAVLLYAPPIFGLPGVWFGLTLSMGLRTVAGFIRLLSKSGPWWFLHRDSQSIQLASQ